MASRIVEYLAAQNLRSSPASISGLPVCQTYGHTDIVGLEVRRKRAAASNRPEIVALNSFSASWMCLGIMERYPVESSLFSPAASSVDIWYGREWVKKRE